MSTEAVIVSALRIRIGTAFKGTLRNTTAFDLADRVVTAAAEGLEQIDDVVPGEGLYGRGVVARHAAIATGRSPHSAEERARQRTRQ